MYNLHQGFKLWLGQAIKFLCKQQCEQLWALSLQVTIAMAAGDIYEQGYLLTVREQHLLPFGVVHDA